MAAKSHQKTMRPKKVFVSYCSKQGEWVWDRLVPCLKAGGADVLIDRERFKIGKAVFRQMDDVQDQADRHVLVLSKDYLQSRPCKHEMARALALDPTFEKGLVLPVLRENCSMPLKVAKPDLLYVDLCNDKVAPQWAKLMDAFDGGLGVDPPTWLNVRDEVRRYLRRKDSVNFVVSGKPKWKPLIHNLCSDDDPKAAIEPLAIVDLEAGACASRRGLVSQIIKAFGASVPVPPEPEDLVTLDEFITSLAFKPCLSLLHFDYVLQRPQYGVDLWGTLRNLVTDKRKISLFIQSRAPIQSFVPTDHPLSSGFTSLKTVELKGCP